MEMINGLFNRGGRVKLLGLLAGVFWLTALSGCNDDDVVVGEPFYHLFTENYRPLMECGGGCVEVPIHEKLRDGNCQFLFGTVDSFEGFDDIVFEYSHGHNRDFLWNWYDPEDFAFHSADVVNLIPGDGRYSRLTEGMKKSGVEVLENATEFDYQWIHAKVGADDVRIDVAPNQTGTDRHVILLFNHPYPYLFVNMIEVRQRGE